MVGQSSDKIFEQLEKSIANFKHEDMFTRRSAPKEKTTIEKPKKPAKKAKPKAKKAAHVKKPVKKKVKKEIRKPAKKKAVPKPKSAPVKQKHEKIHDSLGIRKISAPKGVKLKKDFVRNLIEKNYMHKTKSRIQNAIVKNEAEKLRKSKAVKKMKIFSAISKENDSKKEPIESIATKNPVYIDENEQIAKAIEIMLKKGISGIPITQNNELIGVIEQDDIVKHIEAQAPAQQKPEIVTAKPVKSIARQAETIARDEPFEKAIQKMDSTNSNRLFVVENKKPVGVVSKDDVLKKVIQSNSRTGIKIHTAIDKLLDMVEQKGRVSTEKASKALGVDVKLVEEWASILDDHGLIKIEYPIMGTIELIKK